jgi:NADP-dependent aldehyde dehydrogenase
MDLHARHLIGAGLSRDGEPGFHGVDPRTGAELAPAYADATTGEIAAACALADAAHPAFDEAGRVKRAALLGSIADGIEAVGAPLIERAMSETGLLQARLDSERGRTCTQLRLFARVVRDGDWIDARIDRADPARTPVPKPDVRSMNVPIGPVAVFGASNFPLAFSVAGGDTASALASGCPVLVKAHPAHPGTSELAGWAIQQAVSDSGLHEGVFSLLFDAQYEVGLRLVQHPAIRAVAFTGSRRGGHALMAAVSRRHEPIPVYAEMGSINPVFVLPGALRERRGSIAAGLHAAVTMGVGQFCTNPGVIVAERSPDAEALVRDLEERMSATAAGTMLTAGICDAYRTGVERFAGIAGVERRAGADDGARAAAAALFVTSATTFLEEESIREELFGPATVLVACEDRAQLLDVARSLEGQLSVTVHATHDDLLAHRELLRILETKAGRVVFNGIPTGLEVGPATVHGGPYPATSDGRSTSVGTRAIERFVRPVCYQDSPDDLLPAELREENPLEIQRLIDGERRR